MITKIRIRNFRSFKDITVKLKPFNVLIGPNDSGKSNFLDAFRVISDMMLSRLDNVFFVPFQSFNALVFQGAQNKTISFDVEGKTRTADRQEPFEFEYSVEISPNKKGALHIPTERLKIKRAGAKKCQYINRTGEITKVREETNNRKRSVLYHFDSDKCAVSLLSDIKRHAYIRAVRHELGFSWLYMFQPSKMNSPVEKKEKGSIDVILSEDGSNLGEVLFYLQENCPDKFKNLKNSLKDAIPSVEDLKVTLIEKLIFVFIKQHYNGQLLKLNLKSVSDGLLRFLGILSVVYNPATPSILLFEELENGIHPRRLQTAVNLIRFLSQFSQVFVTTHSPYLVDCVASEDVLVVDKSPVGFTTIKPIRDKLGISKLLDEFSLGEAWFSGALGGIP